MRRRYRVTHRPSKASGAMGAVFGGVFVLIGLFVVIPTFGAFGILWTLFAAAIMGFNLYAAFGKNKNGTYNEYMGQQVDIEQDTGAGFSVPEESENRGGASDIEERLQQLLRLYETGLITRDEYDSKREEILREL